MEGIPGFLTPGFGNRFADWIRILRWRGRRGISPKYIHRVVINGAICGLSGPFQYYETLRLGKAIGNTRIDPAPVFIIGHWRSGTTLLHNLMARDEQFGYIQMVQSLFPHAFLTNPLFPWLTRTLMPATRPMDDMRLYNDSPQEEEMAMLNYGPWSFYHGWHFPGSLWDFYLEMVRQKGLPEADKKAWQKAYLNLLRKTTYHAGGRKLLLKNPANTARIPVLLNMFPEARFIFLHRDPLEVFPSIQKLYRNVVPVFQLQDMDARQIDEDIIRIYKDLLKTYLKDKTLLGENRLQEVMYTDLAQNPVGVIERLYKRLELGPFDKIRPSIEKYLDERKLRGYSRARYDLPHGLEERLRKEWAFALENWPLSAK